MFTCWASAFFPSSIVKSWPTGHSSAGANSSRFSLVQVHLPLRAGESVTSGASLPTFASGAAASENSSATGRGVPSFSTSVAAGGTILTVEARVCALSATTPWISGIHIGFAHHRPPPSSKTTATAPRCAASHASGAASLCRPNSIHTGGTQTTWPKTAPSSEASSLNRTRNGARRIVPRREIAAMAVLVMVHSPKSVGAG